MRKGLFGSIAAAAVAGAAFLSSTAPAAAAPDFRCNTAKLIVPWKAGGGTQVIFAIFEDAIKRLDVPVKVQVVTIPGQGGNKGAKEAARAKPDGCTLFAIHQSAITSYLNGRIDFSYEAFETVSLLTATPDIVGANGDQDWQSMDDLIKDAKENPEEILTGATFGSTSQFMWLLLEDETGMKFKYVPFDGTRERMTALLAGTIQLGTINVASGRKYIENGELKALGIAAEERAPQIPDVPTLKEQGIDLVYALKRGIVAPKGTPKDKVEHWAQIFKQAAEDEKLREQLTAKGTNVEWVGPEDYRAWAEETMASYKKVAKKIGMYKGD
jgi:tripartite-type tricarboxylate transporter receptor subunit TctC